MVIAAVLETAGISMFIPLLEILVSPGRTKETALTPVLTFFFGDTDADQFVVTFCIGLAAFFVIKGLLLGVITYIQQKFVAIHQARYAQKLLEIYLTRSYSFHLQRNSMELIRNVTMLSARVFYRGLLPVLQLAMETLIVSGIFLVLMIVDPISTLLMGGVLGSAVILYYVILRNRVRYWGEQMVQLDSQMLICINQALGSIKETKLYGHESFFVDAFTRPTSARALFGAKTSTAPQLSRLFIEAIAIGALALLVAGLVNDPEVSIDAILPTLGLFAVAAIRLMPSLSKIVSAVTTLRENVSAIDILYNDMNAVSHVSGSEKKHIRQENNDPSPFQKQMTLRNVNYSYENSDERQVVNLNLEIDRGQSVAFVGASGAGKTTLMDLILGLLHPTYGEIKIDGKPLTETMSHWQSLIGYVPQDVYILDDTLRHNIALGHLDSGIDETLLNQALAYAQLTDVVADLPNGVETMLGENGTRFSGGQRQRIGIARALYHQPEVLVMDEATSALDSETENEITNAIHQLSGEKTVLIIAHRLSTVRHCDKIVMMDKGKLVDTGTFDELKGRCPQFKRLVDLADLQGSELG